MILQARYLMKCRILGHRRAAPPPPPPTCYNGLELDLDVRSGLVGFLYVVEDRKTFCDIKSLPGYLKISVTEHG